MCRTLPSALADRLHLDGAVGRRAGPLGQVRDRVQVLDQVAHGPGPVGGQGRRVRRDDGPARSAVRQPGERRRERAAEPVDQVLGQPRVLAEQVGVRDEGRREQPGREGHQLPVEHADREPGGLVGRLEPGHRDAGPRPRRPPSRARPRTSGCSRRAAPPRPRRSSPARAAPEASRSGSRITASASTTSARSRSPAASKVSASSRAASYDAARPPLPPVTSRISLTAAAPAARGRRRRAARPAGRPRRRGGRARRPPRRPAPPCRAARRSGRARAAASRRPRAPPTARGLGARAQRVRLLAQPGALLADGPGQAPDDVGVCVHADRLPAARLWRKPGRQTTVDSRSSASSMTAASPGKLIRTNRWPTSVSKSTPVAIAMPVRASRSWQNAIESWVRWPTSA